MRTSLAAFAALIALPSAAQACACGCAIFDVGTSSLLPNGPGATVFLEYDFLNQTTNWSGGSAAPGANNDDKKIRSDFMLVGAQYMFDEDWGAMIELPVTHRGVLSTDSGSPEETDHTALGDVRLMVNWSGLSSDMSTGITLGVKLPTGDSTFADFEPDLQVSSGSTDLLIGGYHSGNLTADGRWGYYGQAVWQHVVATQHDYTPGDELNAATGVSYEGWLVGTAQISPVFQAIASFRGRDGGIGDPANTGYTRLLLSPGLKADFGTWHLYSDIEVPVAQTVNGNQLVAPIAVKLIASYQL
jgi:hypothetical protein